MVHADVNVVNEEEDDEAQVSSWLCRKCLDSIALLLGAAKTIFFKLVALIFQKLFEFLLADRFVIVILIKKVSLVLHSSRYIANLDPLHRSSVICNSLVIKTRHKKKH